MTQAANKHHLHLNTKLIAVDSSKTFLDLLVNFILIIIHLRHQQLYPPTSLFCLHSACDSPLLLLCGLSPSIDVAFAHLHLNSPPLIPCETPDSQFIPPVIALAAAKYFSYRCSNSCAVINFDEQTMNAIVSQIISTQIYNIIKQVVVTYRQLSSDNL